MNTVIVGISDIKFAEFPQVLVTYGLGSCVAIILHAREARIGSMAHIMLPEAHSDEVNLTPGKFADTAIAFMASEMNSRGIEPPQMVAKITGGADMFSGQFNGRGRRIGARNILSAQKVLDDLGILLVAQDVGGMVGRSVEFSVETGSLTVRTLQGGIKEL